MTYNIRFDRKDKPVTSSANEWENRKDQVVSLIKSYSPDFFCLQEDLIHQLEYINNALDGYKWTGLERSNAKTKSEFCSIHYNSEYFELIPGTFKTTWLSETPDVPSTSWDGTTPRIINCGKFREKKSGREFYVFNTHFEHAGQTARVESAKIVLQLIEGVSRDIPYIVLGDFNISEDNAAYKILTSQQPILQDAFYITENPPEGPEFTMSGFKVQNETDKRRRIDFIFVSNDIQVNDHIIIDFSINGNYLSDHLPVFIKCNI